jgi:hypothetical protein
MPPCCAQSKLPARRRLNFLKGAYSLPHRSAHTAQPCTTAASTRATTIVPTPIWSAFTANASKSSLAQPARSAPITFPSLEEARAVGEALSLWPELEAQLPVWCSFSCRDDEHVSHGERVADCAALVAAFPQTVAIGVNCVPPAWIPSLINELRAASDKPVLVYPNSGEGWDAERRSWTGTTDAAEFGALAAEWFHAGAQIVGGCCRTRPAHIAEVVRAKTSQ